MALRMLKLITLMFACMFAASCATGSKTPSDSDSAVMPMALEQVAVAKTGDIVSIDDVPYRVVEVYVAASGRTCKKLRSNVADAVRVACRINRGDWYLREPLTGSNHPDLIGLRTGVAPTQMKSPTLNVTSAHTDMVPARSENGVISVAILPDENLWRFSRRVTGTATNWERIARYNGIENVTTVVPGRELLIPPELTVLAVSR